MHAGWPRHAFLTSNYSPTLHIPLHEDQHLPILGALEICSSESPARTELSTQLSAFGTYISLHFNPMPISLWPSWMDRVWHEEGHQLVASSVIHARKEACMYIM
jgi:hypothetical protein